MHPLNRPEVMVGFAQDKINKEGVLTDEPTREFIRKMLVSLVEWTNRLKIK
jgi:chromate reductase